MLCGVRCHSSVALIDRDDSSVTMKSGAKGAEQFLLGPRMVKQKFH